MALPLILRSGSTGPIFRADNNGDVLTFNAATGKWVGAPAPSGGSTLLSNAVQSPTSIPVITDWTPILVDAPNPDPLQVSFGAVSSGATFLVSLQLVSSGGGDFGTGAKVTYFRDGEAGFLDVPNAISIATTETKGHYMFGVRFELPTDVADLRFRGEWTAFGDVGTFAIDPTGAPGGGVVLTVQRLS